MNLTLTPTYFHSQSFENVQLQVKLELEHERRLRIQMALDDSEKRNVVLKREVETKTKHCEDLEKQMNEAQSKFKAKMKQVRKYHFFSSSFAFVKKIR